jgi:hypothetical protein
MTWNKYEKKKNVYWNDYYLIFGRVWFEWVQWMRLSQSSKKWSF